MTKLNQTLSVAVLNGDGIGPEVTAEALKVARLAAATHGIELRSEEIDLGAERYLRSGHVMDQKDLDLMASFDAVLLGALGDPRVPPGILERGVIVAMRRHFRQTVNLRPVKLLPGVVSPLRDVTPERCDFVVVRENTEGLYAGGSSQAQAGTEHSVAIQTSITTYAATKEVIRYAFELAATRSGHLTVCHKTNILVDAGKIWSAVTDDLRSDFPDVEVDYAHADAMTLHMVQRPESFDVVVTDNLFGDILSDLGAAIAGGLGTAASGNLNLDGSGPSMFEPVHGSAPDIAGTARANPAAAILSAAMMLDHLGATSVATTVRSSAEHALRVFADQNRSMVTSDFGDEAAGFVQRQAGLTSVAN